jgi:hypothetical protein
MNIDQIKRDLRAAAAHRPAVILAHTFMGNQTNNSSANPVQLQCEDGNTYFVKSRHAGRSIFNDQAIAHLGRRLNAPVGTPAIIMIPEELQQNEPQLHSCLPGLAHGCLLIRDVTDRLWLEHIDESYNRPRFASLAILYGWVHARDRQLIYSNHDPYLVHSVDHGHFFPGGPNWTAGSLTDNLAAVATVEPYADLKQGCGLSDVEIKSTSQELRRIGISGIIDVVAIPPDEWGVTEDERAALVEFLATRREKMLSGLS